MSGIRVFMSGSPPASDVPGNVQSIESDHRDNLALGVAVALDVSLGSAQAGMAGQLLYVSEASPGFDDLAGGAGDEGPPARVRGTSDQAKTAVQLVKPHRHRGGGHALAALGIDHRPSSRRGPRRPREEDRDIWALLWRRDAGDEEGCPGEAGVPRRLTTAAPNRNFAYISETVTAIDRRAIFPRGWVPWGTLFDARGVVSLQASSQRPVQVCQRYG